MRKKESFFLLEGQRKVKKLISEVEGPEKIPFHILFSFPASTMPKKSTF